MTGGRVIVLRGDARALPLPDASVDLIVTSPPYWVQRDYGYDGQLGSEPTWQEWLANLVDCTRDWMRVLKPEGSLFVNLGDKSSSGAGPQTGRKSDALMSTQHGHGGGPKWATTARQPAAAGTKPKCLLGLPWRYALACTDQLGLILRAEIIWAKPNGLPESVTDRVRRSHEQIFHMTKLPRYYSAVDEVREPSQIVFNAPQNGTAHHARAMAAAEGHHRYDTRTNNPLGKLPGSVWEIPSQPLTVPARLGVDHFAAFPMELPRRLVLGWSPPGVCVACGQGRRPVVDKRYLSVANGYESHGRWGLKGQPQDTPLPTRLGDGTSATITGYVCACTPHTDHPERRGTSFLDHREAASSGQTTNGSERNRAYREGRSGPSGPVREYDFDAWTPPPTRPAIVLDPFAGTGTTMLVAAALGRVGIGVDRSWDYSKLAKWRTSDPGERAKAMQVPKPPPQLDGQGELFEELM